MITQDQKAELRALIGVYRTKAVRRYAVHHGTGSPQETADGVDRNYQRASNDLNQFLDRLTEEQDDNHN